jgi:hypothetical protein
MPGLLPGLALREGLEELSDERLYEFLLEESGESETASIQHDTSESLARAMSGTMSFRLYVFTADRMQIYSASGKRIAVAPS